jgi:alkanesulfonate monooxygenase SsuD/methylene tetrahydromethanopterin reductase-like flavin-dependent oxidoreductase (luciferase family)
MKVPPALIDEVALVGPKERVRDRLQRWRDAPITTLNVTVFDVEALRVMVELVGEIG